MFKNWANMIAAGIVNIHTIPQYLKDACLPASKPRSSNPKSKIQAQLAL